jgi:hypothetical protein
MPFITLGTSSQLQIKVPTRGSTGWDETMRTDTFLKIAQHNHTGSGNGEQLGTSAISADAITGAKIRLDNDEYLRGRNQADSADKNIIKVNTSDELEFGTTVGTIELQDDGLTIVDNGDNTKKIAFDAASITTSTTRTLTVPDANITLVGAANTQTLTNKTISADDNTLSGIAASSFVLSDGSGNIDGAASQKAIPSGVVVGTTDTQTLSNKTITSAANTLTIDADVSTVSNIKNAEIKAGAAIAVNKLAALTASRAVVSDGSGFLSAATTTSTEIGYVNGVTSAIQTQIDGKLPTTITTTGDIIYSSSGSTAARLGIGSAGQVLQVSGGVPAWGTNTASPVAPTSKTTTYTALTTDDTILADTSGGAWTLTLYAASGNGGRRLRIKKTTSDSNLLTIDGNASETLDGATTLTLAVQYEEITIQCDGTNWIVLDRYVPTIAADGYLGSAQTISNNTVTKIEIDSTGEGDTYSALDLTTDYDFTAPADGWYSVMGQIHWASNSTGTRLTMIYKNGGELFRTNYSVAADGISATSKVIKLSKGDTLDLRGYQSSGGNLNAQAGQGRTFLNVIWQGY